MALGLRGSLLKKILIAVAAALSFGFPQSPSALAQHAGHVAGGRVVAPRIVGPPVPRTAMARPAVAFPYGPTIFRRRLFLNPPFFAYWQGYNSYWSYWWLYCGPVWGAQFDCDDLLLNSYSYEHYLAPPLTYATPVYAYVQDGRPLVQIYLKDGTVYSVNDYWFVDNQLHFTALDESGTRSVEQVLDLDDLDLQKTIDVNTRRGFRFVMRNEPLEQYLRDHPGDTPPLVQAPKP
jgi:hypothetical protein